MFVAETAPQYRMLRKVHRVLSKPGRVEERLCCIGADYHILDQKSAGIRDLPLFIIVESCKMFDGDEFFLRSKRQSSFVGRICQLAFA